MIANIKNTLKAIKNNPDVPDMVFRKGQGLYYSGQIQLLTQSSRVFELLVSDEYDDYEVELTMDDQTVVHKCDCGTKELLCHHRIGALIQLMEEVHRSASEPEPIGKAYTRKGMIRRVMTERKVKAEKGDYKVALAANDYGEHELTNEKDIRYKLTFRDIEQEIGYCSCPDYRHNKLGTCKHLIHAFNYFKTKRKRKRKKTKHTYPFIEIFLDPLKDYQISWYYPHPLVGEPKTLIHKYFGEQTILAKDKIFEFLHFIGEAEAHKQIYIRQEVLDKVERAFNLQTLEAVKAQYELDFSLINAKLFPYQKEGIEFATYRDGAIIADDMGLGKTIQAIGTAVLKKQLFDFKKTLVVCPASIKEQWKNEIEKFSDEKAVVIQGNPKDRVELYQQKDTFFFIVNYETVIRDVERIRQYINPDFVILDEAQRIKNYATKTAAAIKALPRKHALVITGTPIENRLIDLYSIVNFLDPQLLAPLWEFSYQHCYFDPNRANKINGYYNLQSLKQRLSNLVIRREKRQVIKQLPQITQLDIPVPMHPEQRLYHSEYAQGIAKIIQKKFITPFDKQKLMLLLVKMRMTCDSTFLVDPESNVSPKLKELKHILLEKLNIKKEKRKVIIFSEWIKMNNIIAKMLRENKIGFAQLSGKVPVKKRGKLIEKFEKDKNCLVLLSTEAGGTGLNLQFADTVINFELPWNPAKKNQRIGRIDRIGQLHEHLTVINFITQSSIETRIAAGLLLKQNLFEGVLNPASTTDMLDFSTKGRGQFFEQIQTAVEEMLEPNVEEFEEFVEEQDELQELIASTIAETPKPEEIAQSPPTAAPTVPEEQRPTDELERIVAEEPETLESLEEPEPAAPSVPEEQRPTDELERIVAEEPETLESLEEPEPAAPSVPKEATVVQEGGENSEPATTKAPAREHAPTRQETATTSNANTGGSGQRSANYQAEQVEQVMNQGLGFLAGLFKMATGQDLGAEEQSIEVNRETGEVVMRFKLPI